MRIGILTAVWRRHELFYIFAKHLHSIQKPFKSHTFINLAVVSEDLNQSLLCDCNFKTLRQRNNPVSEKFNAGMQEMREHNPDYVMILGSDDLISKKALSCLISKMKKDIDLIGISDCFFYDVKLQSLHYYPGYSNHRRGEAMGGGRCLSKRLLKELNWRP